MSSVARGSLALLAWFAAFGSSACEAIVPSSLDSVVCTTPNVVGPPACPSGQVCSHSACVACGKTELCGNAIDDDCNGTVDDGCFSVVGGAGGQAAVGGSAGTGGSTGGVGGAASGSGGSLGGSDSGGVAGQQGGRGGMAGDAGSAGTTDVGGSGGSGGQATGGTMSAGAGGVSMGGAAGSGGGNAALGYGDDCSKGGVCPSDAFCLDWSELGETMSGQICTKPCCSSSQCGSGSSAVCWPTPSGGGMCVRGASVGRGNVGTGALGSACSDTDESMFCRSGFCDSGACNDVCCHDSNCAAAPGTQCIKNYLSDANPIRYGYQCGPPKGTRGYADPTSPCGQDSSCESYACDLVADGVATFCSKDCCTSSECGTANFLGDQFQIACVYSASTNGYVRSCAAASDTWGSGQLGASCSTNEDCATDYCVLPDGYCSDTCCTDNDCGGDPFHCKPYQSTGSGIGVFRCIK